MKAIETMYKGYRMRSRIEARWGVFFDALGIAWEYEKEGFDLEGEWYLPDFWLSEQRRWIEIKGQEPTDEEKTLINNLGHSDYPACIFYGEPGRNDGYAHLETYTDSHGGCYTTDEVRWFICSQCGKVDVNICPNNNHRIYAWVSDERHEEITHCECGVQYRDYSHPRLLAAYTAARQARFEHGERGK